MFWHAVGAMVNTPHEPRAELRAPLPRRLGCHLRPTGFVPLVPDPVAPIGDVERLGEDLSGGMGDVYRAPGHQARSVCRLEGCSRYRRRTHRRSRRREVRGASALNEHAEGAIALQDDAGTVKFRNVRIEQL